MDYPFLKPSPEGIVLEVFVQPKATRDAVVGIHGNALKLKVSAPAQENRANDAVLRYLADLLGTKKSKVSLLAGQTSRNKRILVKDMDIQAITTALQKVV